MAFKLTIRIGDRILFSAELLQHIHDMPGHRSVLVYVNRITRNDDGTLTMLLSEEKPLESPGFLRAVQGLADAEAREAASAPAAFLLCPACKHCVWTLSGKVISECPHCAAALPPTPRCPATLAGLVCTYPVGHEGAHGYVDPVRLGLPPVASTAVPEPPRRGREFL